MNDPSDLRKTFRIVIDLTKKVLYNSFFTGEINKQ